MHEQFLRDMTETTKKRKEKKEKSWAWMRKGDQKVQTEALVFAAQEQALRRKIQKKNAKDDMAR